MSQIQWLAGQVAEMKDNVILLNVSVDLPYALKRYQEEKKIENAVFLSDHLNTGFGKEWGVLLEEIRLLARGLFIVDEESVILYAEVSYDELFTGSLNYDAISMALAELELFR